MEIKAKFKVGDIIEDSYNRNYLIVGRDETIFYKVVDLRDKHTSWYISIYRTDEEAKLIDTMNSTMVELLYGN